MLLHRKSEKNVMKRIVSLALTLAVIVSAMFALPISANAAETQTAAVMYGDTNSDGKINLFDLILLRKYLAKWSVDIDLQAADAY